MKRKPTEKEKHEANQWDATEQAGDALWSLLGKATKHEAGDFFARDTVRKVRLSETRRAGGVYGFFSLPRLALAGTACLCALMVYVFFQKQGAEQISTAEAGMDESSQALSELVIIESLKAAAQDPSIYTRDELIAMIGF